MKVMHYALASKFGTESVDKIMEVVGATPNPEMDAEILLGIYNEPKLEGMVIHSRTKGTDQIRTLTSADFWKDEVHYQYNSERIKYIYIHKDTDRSLITPENYIDYALDYGNENSIGYHLPTGEMETNTGSCSISDWKACSIPVEL